MSLVLLSNHLHAAEQPIFRYKIGFEFQEVNKLCKGCSNNIAIQKKEIFTAMLKGIKLWHVEIDGNDIEFVTPPFTYEQADLVKLSIQSIVEAYKVLKNLSNYKGKGNKVTFKEWVEGVGKTISAGDEKRLEMFKSMLPRVASDKEKTEKIQEQISNIEAKGKGIVLGLESILQEKHGIILISSNSPYQAVANISLTIDTAWEPLFMPQVTLQHSLKHTIPLIVSLFSLDSPTRLNDIDRKLISSFPNLSSNKQSLLDPGYFNEENGLIFLHALTCSSIKWYDISQENGLPVSLYQIKDDFENYAQVDAKIGLYFLSRRPFSTMWIDIKKHKKNKPTFVQLYHDKILKDNNSFFSQKIEPNFQYVNYAEENFNPQTHQRLDLIYIKDVFKENLMKHADDENLDFLLKNGILSTGLIHYLFPDVYNEYFQHVISSVDEPASHYYVFNLKENKPATVDIHVDALSPPWFLNPNNAMGAYLIHSKEDYAYLNGKTLVKDFDATYGEAIMEMRLIKNIAPDVLKSMKIESPNPTFLTGKERSLDMDVNGLLSVLNSNFIFEAYSHKIKKFVQ